MDTLKKIFPYSFGVKDVKDLVIKIVIYLVASVVVSLVCWLVGLVLGWIPVVGLLIGVILNIVNWLVGVYNLVGIILAALDFAKVLK